MEKGANVGITLTGKSVIGGQVRGEAIVSRTPFSFFLGLNTDTGVIIEEGHELKGQSVAGKILVYPFGKGSSGDCLRLWRASNNGVAPCALICSEPDFVHVQGAIIANIPMVFNCDRNPVEVIKTGDHVVIEGTVIKVGQFSIKL